MQADIRFALAEDLQLILPLVCAFHEGEQINSTAGGREYALRYLLSHAEFGGIWLIYRAGQLAGYIAICRGFSIEFEGFDAFVDEFYILPPFRGQGLGRQVLEHIQVEARRLDIRALHLEVARDNQRARRLYASAGFAAREQYFLMSASIGQAGEACAP